MNTIRFRHVLALSCLVILAGVAIVIVDKNPIRAADVTRETTAQARHDGKARTMAGRIRPVNTILYGESTSPT